jgi:D-alanine-D-alanine ligase
VSQPAVLFGGPSPEHDISILTGLQAARALAGDGQPVTAIYWSKTADFFAVDPDVEPQAFVDGVPRGSTPLQLSVGPGGGFATEGGLLGKRRTLDIAAVVNCCHGGPGEDGTLQAALDLAGVRYTGPSVAGAALGMDKLAFAAVVAEAGIPHLPCVVASPERDDAPFAGPYIVKPRFGGSSIGIEVIEDWPSVTAFLRSPQPLLRSGAVVEPFRADAVDLEVGVRRYPDVAQSAISKPLRSSSHIYDYRDKYTGGEGMASAPREIPADLPATQEKAVREWTDRIADLVMVRGLARVDFLVTGGEVFVNEINTVPGSLSWMLWVDPTIPFATLLRDMLDEATTGPGRAYSVVGADGSVLRSAGSIAAKLG